MAKGISLHIGLNFVDPNHYGWNGKLNACENDAKDMESIALSQDFRTTLLLREEATRANVIAQIEQAATELNNGDIFYVSYSGHGGQLPDMNEDDEDGQDETWCLFDGQFVDDELKFLWTKFQTGIRILVTSDSCHSGTIIKSINDNPANYSELPVRYMDDQNALAVYTKNKPFYDKILFEVKAVKSSDIGASVLLISGCQDNQYSYDGAINGKFTGALKRVWHAGKFKGDYHRFHKHIVNLLPAYQSPNYLFIGQKNPDFENQKPFTI